MSKREIEILLVEDDEVDAMSVRRAFKKLRIDNMLHHARNGLEALAMLRGEGGPKLAPTPRVVLLDINMPRMNGIEFLQEIRKDPALRSLNVVVFTTSNDERDKVNAYDLNVAGYVLKPVEPAQFFQTMSTLNMYWSLMEYP